MGLGASRFNWRGCCLMRIRLARRWWNDMQWSCSLGAIIQRMERYYFVYDESLHTRALSSSSDTLCSSKIIPNQLLLIRLDNVPTLHQHARSERPHLRLLALPLPGLIHQSTGTHPLRHQIHPLLRLH